MKKYLVIIVALVMVFTIFSGCTAPTTTTAAPTETTAAPTETTAAGVDTTGWETAEFEFVSEQGGKTTGTVLWDAEAGLFQTSFEAGDYGTAIFDGTITDGVAKVVTDNFGGMATGDYAAVEAAITPIVGTPAWANTAEFEFVSEQSGKTSGTVSWNETSFQTQFEAGDYGTAIFDGTIADGVVTVTGDNFGGMATGDYAAVVAAITPIVTAG